MVSEQKEPLILDIHYDGNKLKDHSMDWEEFSSSVNGLVELSKSIAESVGIEKKDVNIKIVAIKEGGVVTQIAANIAEAAVTAAVIGVGYFGVIKPLKIEEKLEAWGNRLFSFINHKKENKNKLLEMPQEWDAIDTDIYQNKANHEAVASFFNSLDMSSDSVDFKITYKQEFKRGIVVEKKDRQYYKNPFADNDLPPAEKITEEDVTLRLEGSHITGEDWSFIQIEKRKDGSEKKIKIEAEVLDNYLLQLGRENALKVLKDKDLYCVLKTKTIKKVGQKRSLKKKYIISCSTEEKLNL